MSLLGMEMQYTVAGLKGHLPEATVSKIGTGALPYLAKVLNQITAALELTHTERRLKAGKINVSQTIQPYPMQDCRGVIQRVLLDQFDLHVRFDDHTWSISGQDTVIDFPEERPLEQARNEALQQVESAEGSRLLTIETRDGLVKLRACFAHHVPKLYNHSDGNYDAKKIPGLALQAFATSLMTAEVPDQSVITIYQVAHELEAKRVQQAAHRVLYHNLDSLTPEQIVHLLGWKDNVKNAILLRWIQRQRRKEVLNPFTPALICRVAASIGAEREVEYWLKKVASPIRIVDAKHLARAAHNTGVSSALKGWIAKLPAEKFVQAYKALTTRGAAALRERLRARIQETLTFGTAFGGLCELATERKKDAPLRAAIKQAATRFLDQMAQTTGEQANFRTAYLRMSVIPDPS